MVCCFVGIGACIVFGLFAFGGCWVVFPSVLPVAVVGMSKPPRDFPFGGFFSGVGGGRFVLFRLAALAYHKGGSLMSSMWGVVRVSSDPV